MSKSKSAVVLACVAACTSAAPAPNKVETQVSARVEAKAEAAPASQPKAGDTAAPGPSRDVADRAFGAALSSTGDTVDVADILRDPAPFLGKTLKTSGVVARVCEKAGCWLELRPSLGEGGLRVPMAGHAFFMPQDVVGRPAIVEGELHAQALSPSHKEHLEGEGAQAVGPLSLDAKGVLVH